VGDNRGTVLGFRNREKQKGKNKNDKNEEAPHGGKKRV
jgi:hypothetical protein